MELFGVLSLIVIGHDRTLGNSSGKLTMRELVGFYHVKPTTRKLSWVLQRADHKRLMNQLVLLNAINTRSANFDIVGLNFSMPQNRCGLEWWFDGNIVLVVIRFASTLIIHDSM